MFRLVLEFINGEIKVFHNTFAFELVKECDDIIINYLKEGVSEVVVFKFNKVKSFYI